MLAPLSSVRPRLACCVWALQSCTICLMETWSGPVYPAGRVLLCYCAIFNLISRIKICLICRRINSTLISLKDNMRKTFCSRRIIIPNHNRSSGAEPPASRPHGYRGNVAGSERMVMLESEFTDRNTAEKTCLRKQRSGRRRRKKDFISA